MHEGLLLNALVACLLDVLLLRFLDGEGQLSRTPLWLLWRICGEKKWQSAVEVSLCILRTERVIVGPDFGKEYGSNSS